MVSTGIDSVKKRRAAPASGRTFSTGVDVRELMKVGAHFGHRVAYWHPGMAPYIHSRRQGIYIIDLFKTAEQLSLALDFVAKTAAGGQILFVGTKRHLRAVVKAAAESARMPYVVERWFGGILTNFSTIGKRLKFLRDQEAKLAAGELAANLSKREFGEAKEEMSKLNTAFGGIKNMERVPAAVFIADVITDRIAVKEASKLGIPVVAIVDTNGDPEPVDYVIPANDDATSALELISNLIAEAVKRGRLIKAVPSKTKPDGVAGPKAKDTVNKDRQ